MIAVVAIVLIADAIVVFMFASYASPDRRNFIDEHQGDGAIRDDWALEWLDADVEAGTTTTA